jgi:hypothetical protein
LAAEHADLPVPVGEALRDYFAACRNWLISADKQGIGPIISRNGCGSQQSRGIHKRTRLFSA